MKPFLTIAATPTSIKLKWGDLIVGTAEVRTVWSRPKVVDGQHMPVC